MEVVCDLTKVDILTAKSCLQFFHCLMHPLIQISQLAQFAILMARGKDVLMRLT